MVLMNVKKERNLYKMEAAVIVRIIPGEVVMVRVVSQMYVPIDKSYCKMELVNSAVLT